MPNDKFPNLTAWLKGNQTRVIQLEVKRGGICADAIEPVAKSDNAKIVQRLGVSVEDVLIVLNHAIGEQK